MSASNFNTANLTYRQLIGNGQTYNVPHFQRDYSWSNEEWDDLWLDINNLIREHEDAHYMGYLVLRSKDSKNFDIVDGQQRLTTLSILALAVLKNFERFIKEGVDPENNKLRQEQLRNSFIGYLDPVTLLSKSKLTLNRNNDHFYQSCIVSLTDIPKHNLSSSNRLLREAFKWFEKKTWDNYGAKLNGAELAAFIDKLSDKLFFTVIKVTDELNAYKVFETLNARGVKLSATDLFKNYLFSVIYKDSKENNEISQIESKWEELVSQLGGDDFPNFLRAHWNSRKSFARHTELFKTIRNSIKTRAEVFKLLREMEEDVGIYAALSEPEDNLWSNPNIKTYIGELRMFSVRQIYPLLMAIYQNFGQDDFELMLKAASVISFRYNVICNNSANDQERIYNTVAEKVSSQEFKSINDVLNSLKAIYPNDDAFEYAFAHKELRTTQTRNKKVLRYILFKLENHISQNIFDPNADIYNIEHILPEHPDDGWDSFSDEQHEQFLYRIGNMTLLDRNDNKELGNHTYDVKKIQYSKSCFKISTEISNLYDEWGVARINSRQAWMAKQAKSIWKISQLS